MKRIGIDLGELRPDPRPRPVPACPGAALRISRDEFDAFVRGGELFVTSRGDIPVNERGDARVMCRNEVQVSPSVLGNDVVYGLCRSCSDLEARHRRAMREMLARQGQR